MRRLLATDGWTLGRLLGVDVKLHPTFLLLPAWLIGSTYWAGGGWADAWPLLLVTAGLFACVVMHEYGHVLTARVFGVRTRDILITPIGGVARLLSIPRQPVKELLVAVAGPAVNVLLASLLAAGLWLVGGVNALRIPDLNAFGFFVRTPADYARVLLVANVVLVVFNLLPAFPMDGGRMLRATLAFVLPYATATRWAAWLGQLLAIGFALLGAGVIQIPGVEGDASPMLMLLGAFVFFGAQAESRLVQNREALAGIRVGEIMLTQFHVLPEGCTLPDAVSALRAGWQREFPVLVEGRLGLATRDHILESAAALPPDATVAGLVTYDVSILTPDRPAVDAATRIGRGPGESVLVVDEGRIVGMVTRDKLTDAVRLRRAAVKRSRLTRKAAPATSDEQHVTRTAG